MRYLGVKANGFVISLLLVAPNPYTSSMKITIETIDSRVSVRSYSGQALSSDDRRVVESAIASSGPCPFGTKPHFAVVEPDALGDAGSGKIGTYGIIKNAPAFIVGATRPAPFAFADFGYALEGIVLHASAYGLGTCWLGGTFNRTGAMSALRLSEGELVPAITPVGDPAERRSFIDSAVRAMAGSRKRKPWNELFFDGNFDRPLEENDSGDWAAVLEAVRKGPSASNKQPWRIVRTGTGSSPAFHLFLDEDRTYSNAIRGIRIQEMDIGIAMRHFEAAARILGLPGSWARLGDLAFPYEEPLVYYSSWIF